jgi:hypothetical protein
MVLMEQLTEAAAVVVRPIEEAETFQEVLAEVVLLYSDTHLISQLILQGLLEQQ